MKKLIAVLSFFVVFFGVKGEELQVNGSLTVPKRWKYSKSGIKSYWCGKSPFIPDPGNSGNKGKDLKPTITQTYERATFCKLEVKSWWNNSLQNGKGIDYNNRVEFIAQDKYFADDEGEKISTSYDPESSNDKNNGAIFVTISHKDKEFLLKEETSLMNKFGMFGWENMSRHVLYYDKKTEMWMLTVRVEVMTNISDLEIVISPKRGA